jgi:WD40 repeat protein
MAYHPLIHIRYSGSYSHHSLPDEPGCGYLLAAIAHSGRSFLSRNRTYSQVVLIILAFLSTKSLAGIAFSADGTRAITGAGYYGRAILWDVGAGKEIKCFTYPFKGGPVLGVDFGPGESSIIGSGDADLYLWDAESGEIIRRHIGHSPWPWTLDLSSDDRYVISGGLDGNLILWDFALGEELHRISFPQTIFDAVFSPDGKTAYAVAQEGRLFEWHIAEKSLLELLDWIKSNRYVRELTCEER